MTVLWTSKVQREEQEILCANMPLYSRLATICILAFLLALVKAKDCALEPLGDGLDDTDQVGEILQQVDLVPNQYRSSMLSPSVEMEGRPRLGRVHTTSPGMFSSSSILSLS